ncbi:MAG: GIY-YIG nuclease family protein [Candidatus Paceibacterota bacterium]|jgi:putative endonuclease
MVNFTYILKCADDTLYIGSTNNLEKRLGEHNNSKSGAHYTKIRRPVELVYSEAFETLKEARGREVELKRLTRAEKLGLIKTKKTRQKS